MMHRVAVAVALFVVRLGRLCWLQVASRGKPCVVFTNSISNTYALCMGSKPPPRPPRLPRHRSWAPIRRVEPKGCPQRGGSSSGISKAGTSDTSQQPTVASSLRTASYLTLRIKLLSPTALQRSTTSTTSSCKCGSFQLRATSMPFPHTSFLSSMVRLLLFVF